MSLRRKHKLAVQRQHTYRVSNASRPVNAGLMYQLRYIPLFQWRSLKVTPIQTVCWLPDLASVHVNSYVLKVHPVLPNQLKYNQISDVIFSKPC